MYDYSPRLSLSLGEEEIAVFELGPVLTEMPQSITNPISPSESIGKMVPTRSEEDVKNMKLNPRENISSETTSLISSHGPVSAYTTASNSNILLGQVRNNVNPNNNKSPSAEGLTATYSPRISQQSDSSDEGVISEVVFHQPNSAGNENNNN